MRNLLLLALLFIATSTFANNEDKDLILKQGSTIISFYDIDGYALSIPKDVRPGFFSSPDRVDTTIRTLLKMKLIYDYTSENDLRNDEKIENAISDYLESNGAKIGLTALSDFDYLKLKKYLAIKFNYKIFGAEIKDSISESDVIELAKEVYEIDKEKYYVDKEKRDIEYISIPYNKENKDEIYRLTQQALDKLIKNEIKVSEVATVFTELADVKLNSGINKYTYNEEFKDFSDFVFQSESKGWENGILDANNRFIIADIKEIYPVGYIPFESAKKNILPGLMKQSSESKFQDILLKVSNNPVEANEGNIISLLDRYKTAG